MDPPASNGLQNDVVAGHAQLASYVTYGKRSPAAAACVVLHTSSSIIYYY